MRTIPAALALALILALTASASSSAQSDGTATATSTHSWYFGAAGFGNHARRGGEDCPYVCGHLGGFSLGGAATVGRVFASTSGLHFSVEGEGSVDTGVESAASVRTAYYMAGAGRRFTADRPQILASVLLRIGDRRRGRQARAEFVGGFVVEFARELTTDIVDTVYQGYDKPLVKVSPPDQSNFAASVGYCFGVDVVTAIGRRTDFTAGGRFYWFQRDSYNGMQQFPIPGAPSIRFQAGVRWNR